MQIELPGKPAFARIVARLDPGEAIVGEADAMACMSAALDMTARFNGGFFPALIRKFLGGESLFVNEFKNSTDKTLELHLAQATPGDIVEHDLADGDICLQPGAFIACAPEVNISVRWAGVRSWIGGEGLFKLKVSGQGKVFYGAYGCVLHRELDGETIVDSSHLVSYDPAIALRIQLAGGLFSSFFGGEGFVTRIEGKGKYTIQTRSMSGLAKWLRPRL